MTKILQSSLKTMYSVVGVNVDGDKITHGGSGFFIHPNLFVTASHLFDEWHFKYQDHEPLMKIANSGKVGTVGINIIEFNNNGEAKNIWRTVNVYAHPGHDMCIFEVEVFKLDNKETWVIEEMDFELPKIGDKVTIHGLADQEEPIIKGKDSIELKATRVGMSANITETFETGMDRFHRRDSVFVIDEEPHNGMSGSPVYNEKGKVVGVVSSGLDDGQTGVCSFLYPLLTTNLPEVITKGLKSRITLLNHLNKGTISARGYYGYTIDAKGALYCDSLEQGTWVSKKPFEPNPLDLFKAKY